MTDQEHKDLVNYRINRAKETIDEVIILVENKKWNSAVNILYYSCFYAVIALLVSENILTKTHSGVRQMFGQHFGKTGLIHPDIAKFYSQIFDQRQMSDYDDFVQFNQEELAEMIPQAQELINAIENYLISKNSF